MSADDVAWWAYLLCALVTAVLGLAADVVARSRQGLCLADLIAVTLYSVAILTGTVGFIALIERVWEG
jgi:hypothetical protein